MPYDVFKHAKLLPVSTIFCIPQNKPQLKEMHFTRIPSLRVTSWTEKNRLQAQSGAIIQTLSAQLSRRIDPVTSFSFSAPLSHPLRHLFVAVLKSLTRVLAALSKLIPPHYKSQKEVSCNTKTSCIAQPVHYISDHQPYQHSKETVILLKSKWLQSADYLCGIKSN